MTFRYESGAEVMTKKVMQMPKDQFLTPTQVVF